MPDRTIRAAIVGGSGYVGGELLRILHGHPAIEVAQITSRRLAGRFVHGTHPNLRGHTKLKFTASDDLQPCDLLFLAQPHGVSASAIESWSDRAEKVVDLSADFRLRSADAYEDWYGESHPNADWLSRFVYGLPELHRDALRDARLASGVGCNATATIFALLPLAKSGLLERAVCDLKVGSSEGGASASASSHHPERSGSVRSFAPVGHRHQAEVLQELGDIELHFSVTSVELVRGALCTAHITLSEEFTEKDTWGLFREFYGNEPFVRLVKDRTGIHRFPDPKILAGSNHCDVGFARDERTGRLVVVSAIDNLVKGAAGSAVQCANLMCGFDETTGLDFPGLHPI